MSDPRNHTIGSLTWLDAVNSSCTITKLEDAAAYILKVIGDSLQSKRLHLCEIECEKIERVDNSYRRAVLLFESGRYCVIEAVCDYEDGVELRSQPLTAEEGARLGLIDEKIYREYVEIQNKLMEIKQRHRDIAELRNIMRRQGPEVVRGVLW